MNSEIRSINLNAGPYNEFKGCSRDIPFECKTFALSSETGDMKVPTGTGSGIDIDPDFIKKHEAVIG